ncbi:hypothetical protein RJ640_010732 [Escallonia rubra]|uniref:Uncharacterized protein n=1 Tax=Escallonia rubra TaxID=112253 RepID=A0AA88UG30_9ASTE|nr:hypothetical protein RJ640_010732 [Escallonia rubra]
MAQASIIVKSLLLTFVVAAFSAATAVSGQDMAPAPAPDTGSAFSVPNYIYEIEVVQKEIVRLDVALAFLLNAQLIQTLLA